MGAQCEPAFAFTRVHTHACLNNMRTCDSYSIERGSPTRQCSSIFDVLVDAVPIEKISKIVCGNVVILIPG